MQGVDRCGCHLVSCLLVKRKKREATHSADYCNSLDCLHSTRRRWDLEVLLRSADAERERRIDSRRLLSGEAQKARCRRDEAAGTCLAEAEVATLTVAVAVTVTVTEAAAAAAAAAA